MEFLKRLFTKKDNPEPRRLVLSGPVTPLDNAPDLPSGPSGDLQNAFNEALIRRGIGRPQKRTQIPSERLWLRQDYEDLKGIMLPKGGIRAIDEPGLDDLGEVIGKGQPYIEKPFGNDGAVWEDGLVYNRDKTTRFLPVEGRGLTYDHGSFYQTFLECGPFRRSWTNLITPLKTGVWRVAPADITKDDLADGQSFDRVRDEAARQARFVERQILRGLEGGWSKHVNEASLALVQGFSPFVELYRGGQNPTLKRLQYKWPSSVNRWFRDADEMIVAAELVDGDENTHIVDADHMLIYSWDEFGVDPEGNGYARSVQTWWEILQLAAQLEAVAAEKFGSPWVYVATENPALENRAKPTEIAELQRIINAAVAAEDPIIVLPDNTKMSIASTAGSLPNFEVMKRFALERLTEILIGESALIAVSKAGSYAARESASDAAIAFAPAIAQWMCEAQNGTDNLRTTGTIPKLVDTHFGGPPVPGMYPQLEFSLSGFSDDAGTDDIITAAQAGLIEVTPAVKVYMHERLNLPSPTEKDTTTKEDGPPTPAVDLSVIKTQLPAPTIDAPNAASQAPVEASEPMQAMNGAQVTSLVDVIQQVAASTLPSEAAVRILMRAFVMSESEARELVAAANVGQMPVQASELPAGFRASEPDYAAISKQLDAFDSALASGFTREVNRWLERVKAALDEARRTNDFTADDIVGQLERLRPGLREALVAVTQGQQNKILRFGAETAAKEIGYGGATSGVDRMADTAALALRVRAVVNEVINRSEGLIIERFAEFARGDATISLPRLATSTIERAASKVTTTALNVGRETFVDEIKTRAERLGLPTGVDIIAERSAVMDNNTCENCRQLDGVRVKFGSTRYFDLAPPNKCLGGSRCRCIYTFIMPDEVAELIGDDEQ